MCRYMYALFGLHSGSRGKLRFHHLAVAIWFAIHILGIGITVKWWHKTLLEAQTITSSMPTILALNLILLGSTVCFQAKIIILHDRLLLLRERTGRQPSEFLTQILLSVPFFLIEFRGNVALRSMEDLLKEIYFGAVHLNVTVLFMISNDVLINLRTSLTNILTHTENLDENEEKIRNEKWKFRDRIVEANRIFAWIWAAQHVRIMILAVFIVSEVLDPELRCVDRILMMMFEGSLLVRLFQLAWRSSAIARSCLKIEERFLNKIQVCEEGREAARHIFHAMTYREEWDIPRSGCFPLETKRFFNFLVTSVTFTAVILQFDHRVAGLLIEAKTEF